MMLEKCCIASSFPCSGPHLRPVKIVEWGSFSGDDVSEEDMKHLLLLPNLFWQIKNADVHEIEH